MQGNPSVNNQPYNSLYSLGVDGNLNIPYILGINPFINIPLPQSIEFHPQQSISTILHQNSSLDSSRSQVPTYPEESKYQQLSNSQREAKWLEIKKYSDFIHRFSSESSHSDINKDNYYDLYNMAVCLLKAIDSLDPEFQNNSNPNSDNNNSNIREHSNNEFHQHSQNTNPSSNPHNFPTSVNPHTGLETLNTRESFDFYYNRGNNESVVDTSFWPKYPSTVHPQQPNIPNPSANHSIPQNNADSAIQGLLNGGILNQNAIYQVPSSGSFYNVNLGNSSFPNPMNSTNNNSGRIPTKNLVDIAHAVISKPKQSTQSLKTEQKQTSSDEKKGKKRRKRIGQVSSSSKRNLQCRMCGATETPEWRRGPAGDHTLCNACGLHYAKSLKKQRKERESRKHSVDLLLNPMEDHSNKNSNETPANQETSTSSSSDLKVINISSNQEESITGGETKAESVNNEKEKESEESGSEDSESNTSTPTSENVISENVISENVVSDNKTEALYLIFFYFQFYLR